MRAHYALRRGDSTSSSLARGGALAVRGVRPQTRCPHLGEATLTALTHLLAAEQWCECGPRSAAGKPRTNLGNRQSGTDLGALDLSLRYGSRRTESQQRSRTIRRRRKSTRVGALSDAHVEGSMSRCTPAESDHRSSHSTYTPHLAIESRPQDGRPLLRSSRQTVDYRCAEMLR